MNKILAHNGNLLFSQNGYILYRTYTPPIPTPSALPVVEHGGEYGWEIPFDWISGGTLSAYISAQSNNYSQDSWEGGFYMARIDDTGDYRRMSLDFSAIGDGKFEMYIEPSNFIEWSYTCQNWNENYGDTSGFVHPAAFQPYNFDGEPYGLFVTGVTI